MNGWLRSPMVGSPELSLVLLTVLSQVAVGAVAFLLFTRFKKKEQAVSADDLSLTRQVVYVSFAFVVVALLASLTHVGHAVRAYRALFYHLSSWMGKEALFLSLFSFSLFVYTILLLKGSGPRKGIEIFAAITGLLGVLSGSLIYTVLGSVPSWNSVFSILFFFLSSLLVGASLFGMISMRKLKSHVEVVKDSCESYSKSIAAVIMPLLIVAIAITVVYLIYLGSRGPEARASLGALVGSFLFWVRIVIGFIAPLFLAVMVKKLLSSGNIAKAATYVSGVFILLLVGETLGRVLFFSTSVIHTIGGNGTPY